MDILEKKSNHVYFMYMLPHDIICQKVTAIYIYLTVGKCIKTLDESITDKSVLFQLQLYIYYGLQLTHIDQGIKVLQAA